MARTCMHVGPCSPQCAPVYESWPFGPTILPLSPGPQWKYTEYSPAPCPHCYCQDAPKVGMVPHVKCCKCGDTRSAMTVRQ